MKIDMQLCKIVVTVFVSAVATCAFIDHKIDTAANRLDSKIVALQASLQAIGERSSRVEGYLGISGEGSEPLSPTFLPHSPEPNSRPLPR